MHITNGNKSQLQLVMSHLLSFGIEVWWVDVDSLLCPPLSGAIWPGGANDLHLPTDGPAEGLAAGSQVDPGVHVLELDRLVALPVVCVAHHLPHISSISFTQLAKGRDLLLVGERRGEMVAVQIPVGCEMFQPNSLTTSHWFPSFAKVIIFWTL